MWFLPPRPSFHRSVESSPRKQVRRGGATTAPRTDCVKSAFCPCTWCGCARAPVGRAARRGSWIKTSTSGVSSLSLWLRTVVFLPWVRGGDGHHSSVHSSGRADREVRFRSSGRGGFSFVELLMCASRTLELRQSGRPAISRRFSSHLA